MIDAINAVSAFLFSLGLAALGIGTLLIAAIILWSMNEKRSTRHLQQQSPALASQEKAPEQRATVTPHQNRALRY